MNSLLFKYTKNHPVHITISKKAELYKRKAELAKIFSQTVESGKIDMVIPPYPDSIRIPVPE